MGWQPRKGDKDVMELPPSPKHHNILEPNVRAVVAVFDETILTLQVICLLCDQIVSLPEVREVFGPDMAYIFAEHLFLEAQYDQLLWTMNIGGVLLMEDADKVIKLATQVKDSFRLICRFIRRLDDPAALFSALANQSIDVMHKPKGVDKMEEWRVMAYAFRRFCGIVQHRMSSSPSEEFSKHETMLLDMQVRLRTAQSRAKSLKEKYEAAQRNRADSIVKVRNKFNRIKKEMKGTAGTAGKDRQVLQMMDEQLSEMNTTLHVNRQDSQSHIQSVASETRALALKHQEEEFQLMRNIRRTTLELEEVIAKYDKDMMQVDTAINKLKPLHESERLKVRETREELAKYVEMRVQWERAEEEKRKREEERRKKTQSSSEKNPNVFPAASRQESQRPS